VHSHNLSAARVFFEDLVRVERRTNHKLILEHILERALLERGPIRYRGRY
jgi:hypothetical protein